MANSYCSVDEAVKKIEAGETSIAVRVKPSGVSVPRSSQSSYGTKSIHDLLDKLEGSQVTDLKLELMGEIGLHEANFDDLVNPLKERIQATNVKSLSLEIAPRTITLHNEHHKENRRHFVLSEDGLSNIVRIPVEKLKLTNMVADFVFLSGLERVMYGHEFKGNRSGLFSLRYNPTLRNLDLGDCPAAHHDARAALREILPKTNITGLKVPPADRHPIYHDFFGTINFQVPVSELDALVNENARRIAIEEKEAAEKELAELKAAGQPKSDVGDRSLVGRLGSMFKGWGRGKGDQGGPPDDQ